MFAGLLLLALGVAHVLRQLSVGLEPGSAVETVVSFVTLQFLPVWLRGAVFGGLGAVLFLFGAWRLDFLPGERAIEATSWLPSWLRGGPYRFDMKETVATVGRLRFVTLSGAGASRVVLTTGLWRLIEFGRLIRLLRTYRVPVRFTPGAASVDDRITIFVWHVHNGFVVASWRVAKDGRPVPSRPVWRVGLNRNTLTAAVGDAFAGHAQAAGLRLHSTPEQVVREATANGSESQLITVEINSHDCTATLEGRPGGWVLTGPVAPPGIAGIILAAAGLEHDDLVSTAVRPDDESAPAGER